MLHCSWPWFVDCNTIQYNTIQVQDVCYVWSDRLLVSADPFAAQHRRSFLQLMPPKWLTEWWGIPGRWPIPFGPFGTGSRT